MKSFFPWFLVLALMSLAYGQEEVIPEMMPLAAGDTIQIHVKGIKALQKNIKIPEDGAFAFPPIGAVSASGRTAKEIEEDIRKRLADGYVKNPEVSVIVSSTFSKTVMVIGAVHQPGPVNVKSGVTMLQLLSMVSGLTDSSNQEAVVIHGRLTAKSEGETTRIPLADLLAGNVANNIAIRHGDVVIFPSVTETGDRVNVLGAVRAPGAYLLVPGKTVVDFVAEAGGPTQGAGNVLMIIPSARNRAGAEKEKPESLELDKILSGQETRQPQLKSGDTLMLLSAANLQMNFFVIGHVRKPGMYPWQEGITVLTAISMAGGLTDTASTNGIQIIKEGGAGKGAPIIAKTSDRIERGDTIVIPEGLF